jgi:hypothetical protein
MKVIFTRLALTVIAFAAPFAIAAPLGTAFTYQGRLATGSAAATGLFDFEFSLWNALSGPTQVGSTLSLPARSVSNGLFAVTLDFGSAPFAGEATWLQIAVRTNAAGAYATLTPRQPLSPTPGAIFASKAGTATTATSATVASGVAANAVTSTGILDGTIAATDLGSGQVVKSLNTLKDSVTLAAGANLTVTPSGQTLTLASPTDWHTTGNTGTTAGVNFLGTTDNQPLEFWVNGLRAFRLEPTALGPNVIGGPAANVVQGSVSGATIGGGSQNLIQSNANHATIAGGSGNQIQGWASGNASRFGFVGGGNNNTVEAFSYYSTIAGGSGNRIQYDADSASLSGGTANLIGTNADYGVISGGHQNIISNGAGGATIPGGVLNTVGAPYGFAAGQRAKANHVSSFVWADSQASDFASTAGNQFLVRALGGVGINKNNPATALDVGGTVTATAFSGPGSGLTGIGTFSLADNSVTAAKLASDGNSLGKVSAGTLTSSGTSVSLTVNGYLTGKDLFLRGGDTNHGLGWYGAGKLFAGNNVDGPAIYGFDGGVLGSTDGGQKVALRWTKDTSVTVQGGLVVDTGNANTGSVSAASIRLGYGSGEGLASKRTSGGNLYGLDLYTGFAPRLSIDQAGRVGIGSTAPTETLDIHGTSRLNDFDMYLRAGTDHNHGLGHRSSVAGIGIDGPFIYGWAGGALGTAGPEMISLKWDWTGNVWVSNNLSVATITIRGGADVAEPFPVSGTEVEPGTVMVIDETSPGHLIRSARAYDSRVAGIVSGAGGVKPGLELQQEGILDQGQKIALTGRVYVKTEALKQPVRPGDLLTTSDLPGHAMKAADRDRAQGAILGKAMTRLDSGTGLVLVLVTLQ